MTFTFEQTPSGVPGLGAIPWGAHYCHFYDGREDLADTLVPFFRAGLEAGNACLWVTSEPFTLADARAALAAAVPDLDHRERLGQIEIVEHRDWYLRADQTEPRAALQGWIARYEAAQAAGFSGLRVTGNTHWLKREDWASFVDYENFLSEAFRNRRIVGLCSYCFDRCTARDVLDVVGSHQGTIARYGGKCQVLESAALKMAREDLMRVHESALALEAAERRKDEFLAILGHELRNPLAPIATAVKLMRLRGAGEGYGAELAAIDRQVRHLTGLVDDLMDVSRFARGVIELRRKVVEISEIVALAIETTSPIIEKRLQRLEVDVPSQGLAVKVDVQRMAQVVTNVLVNAARYTPPGTSIRISAARFGDRVRLQIVDDGPGISPELLDKVFEPFVQGQRSLDREGGGLGLGLSIVKSLVELHGGQVHLRSSAGAGTEVTVDLHVARVEQTVQPSVTDVAPSPEGGARVLLVDDNEDAVELLAEALRHSGYDVRVAGDGPSALRIASEHDPVVAILDIGLPEMDGYHLGRKLREQSATRRIRLIALTGYATERDRARSAEAGFDEHLTKPVEVDAIVSLLRRWETGARIVS